MKNRKRKADIITLLDNEFVFKAKVFTIYIVMMVVLLGAMFVFVLKSLNEYTTLCVLILFVTFPVYAFLLVWYNDKIEKYTCSTDEVYKLIDWLAGKDFDKNKYVDIIYYLKKNIIKNYNKNHFALEDEYISAFNYCLNMKELEKNPREMRRFCGIIATAKNNEARVGMNEFDHPNIETEENIMWNPRSIGSIIWSGAFAVILTLFVGFKIAATVNKECLDIRILEIIYNVGGDIITMITAAVVFFKWQTH